MAAFGETALMAIAGVRRRRVFRKWRLSHYFKYNFSLFCGAAFEGSTTPLPFQGIGRNIVVAPLSQVQVTQC
jgi:hypothetical protein